VIVFLKLFTKREILVEFIYHKHSIKHLVSRVAIRKGWTCQPATARREALDILLKNARKTPRALWEIVFVTPSDRCPATAIYLASTQALLSRHVSSTSKSPDCVVAHRSDRCFSPVRPVTAGQTHRSDRSGAAESPSSVLRSWLC
jgi:hypothetical protein